MSEGFPEKNHVFKIAVFRIPIWVLTFLIWWEVPLELKEEIPCKDLIQSYSGSGKFSFILINIQNKGFFVTEQKYEIFHH